jgi:competence protein ComGC
MHRGTRTDPPPSSSQQDAKGEEEGCHRTVQIIRAQVQKQSLERSNFRT